MEAFQISQIARTKPSTASQAQSSSIKPSSTEDRTAGNNNTKQREQSPSRRSSPSPQFKTAVEKSSRIVKVISEKKHPKMIEGIQKTEKSTSPLTTYVSNSDFFQCRISQRFIKLETIIK